MKHSPIYAALCCTLSACGSGGGEAAAGPTLTQRNDPAPGTAADSASNGGGSGTSGAACAAPLGGTEKRRVFASEANDYSFSSTLAFPPVFVAPDSELSFDWSALSADFLGQPLNVPGDIDTVNLTLWALTQQELEAKLNDDELTQSDLEVIATVYTEDVLDSATLFDFTSVGLPLKPAQILPFVNAESYDPATHTYTLIAATGTRLGQGTRMIQAFKLDPSSTNTEVVMTNASTKLDYTVDLLSLQQTELPASSSAIQFDWSRMTSNALGNEFLETSIDLAVVARYARTPAQLETDFLSLIRFDGSIVADDLWQAAVPSGTAVALDSLTNAAGAPFAGIDDTGTWMIALFCTRCQNPAPWYLSFLTPCGR